MTAATTIFCVIVIILLTLFQLVQADLLFTNEFIIDIDLIYFKLSIYPQRRKKKRKSTLKRKIQNLRLTKRLVTFITKHSHVTVHALSFNIPDISAEKVAIISGATYSLLFSLLGYVQQNTKSLTFAESASPVISSVSPVYIHVSFKLLLFDAIKSFIYYKYETKKAQKVGETND